MQGLFYHYLKDFLERSFDAPLWERARTRAGIPETSFLLRAQYPDGYVGRLFDAARKELQPHSPSLDDLLFSFGRHLGAMFRRDFPQYFDRFPSAREMVAAIEPVIHAELRRSDPRSQPPKLRVTPLPRSRLRLVYDSSRRLCPVARGLIHDVAEAFGERALVEESRCMLRGDPACEMIVAFSEIGSARIAASRL